MQPRAMDCICLGWNSASPNISFLNLETMQNLISVKYKQVTGIPEWIVERMNARAGTQKRGPERIPGPGPKVTPPMNTSTPVASSEAMRPEAKESEIKEPAVQRARK
jgi:hypothetical protein